MRFAYIFATALAIGTAGAQGPNDGSVIVGVVRDASDSGVVGYAEVRVAPSTTRRADGLGRFRVEGLPTGQTVEIMLRVIGYTPLVTRHQLAAGVNDIGNLYLVRVPALLSQVTVRGRSMRVPSGFERIYQRARGSFGQFLTREAIDSLNAPTIADVLSSMTNLRVRDSDSQTFVRVRDCTASVWFNGIPITNPDVVQEVLRSTHPSTIQVMETYDLSTRIPLEFRTNPNDGRSACAVVLIWTRAR